MAPTPPQPPTPSKHQTDTTRQSAITECQESTQSNQSKEAITVKQPPVNITLGNKTYSVCISHLSLDRFYALIEKQHSIKLCIIVRSLMIHRSRPCGPSLGIVRRVLIG